MGWGNIQSFTINSFGTKPYKILLGIKWTDQVSNDRIYQITGQYLIVQKIQQKQLRFMGHSLSLR